MSGEDLHNSFSGRPHWRRGCALLLAVGFAIMIGACMIGGITVQRGLVPAPDVNIRVGPFSLEAEESYSQYCPPHRPCIISANLGQDYYNIWVFFQEPQGEAGRGLFALPLAP